MGAAQARARSFSGNDFALDYSEANTPDARRQLLQQVGRRSLYFRYLQIMEMEESPGDSRPQWIKITALEPASLMDVSFTVNQRVSLSRLREDPVSRPGRAVAVSGLIDRVDDVNRTIHLGPVIVRHKDRLAPLLEGKEMLHDLDDRARFYSFTGSGEPVSLSYRDRDLLQHRDRIMQEGGDDAWAEFLRRQIRRREEARKAGDDVP